METFDLYRHLDELYTAAPMPHDRPVIGITTNYEGIDATLRSVYYRQIQRAGGTPLLIPPIADTATILSTLDSVDAILLTGGADYNPLWNGEEPRPALHHINNERDLPELLLTRYAYDRQLPMLGICRGIQTLATALDGHVVQDIPQTDMTLKHSQDADREEPTHSVHIFGGTTLHDIYKSDSIFVNSFHHQAVDQPGNHFRTSAIAPDGTIEAIESSEHKPMIGVQWHPEWLGEDGLPLFSWLVGEARLQRGARRFHERNISIDSHCDTPMFFPEGIHLSLIHI